MSIDRDMWTSPFSETHLPKWLCPVCSLGYIAMQEPLNLEETPASRRRRAAANLDERDADFIYSAVFTCTNPACRGSVASCGTAELREEYSEFDEDGVPSRSEYVASLTPAYFHPHLVPFQIRTECPPSVADEILKSFQLLFADPASAANHIRQAVENMLTEKGVHRSAWSSRGALVRLSLHRRIEDFTSTRPELSEQLKALKWLGNAGSHPVGITLEGLLDAYEILETVIDAVFVKEHERVARMARRVNKQKGPVHGRSPRS